MSENLKIIFGVIRMPFLILAPVCILLGTATAVLSGSEINFYYLLLALIGAVFAHIAVNSLNEYDDFKTGLDFKTIKTPFSGGSGVLPEHPEKANYSLLIGMLSLFIVVIIGIYFIYVRGLLILPIGLSGVIIAAIYTKYITKNPWLCLIAPGIGFGTLMVMGTNFILSGSYSFLSFNASLIPFFLVSNLLLLNQFPDIQADKEIGRNHFPILLGRKKSAIIYSIFLISAYLSVLFGYFLGIFPVSSLITFISIPLAVMTIFGALKYSDSIPELIPYLGKNVIITLLTPTLLAIGLFLGK